MNEMIENFEVDMVDEIETCMRFCTQYDITITEYATLKLAAEIESGNFLAYMKQYKKEEV